MGPSSPGSGRGVLLVALFSLIAWILLTIRSLRLLRQVTRPTRLRLGMILTCVLAVIFALFICTWALAFGLDRWLVLTVLAAVTTYSLIVAVALLATWKTIRKYIHD